MTGPDWGRSLQTTEYVVQDTSHPKSLLSRFDRMLMPFEDVANFLAATAIFMLMVLGVLQIGLRSIFNAPITGYIDLVELSMASMAFLGAAYCQRLGAHIRMELLVGRLHGRALWAAEIFGTLVALFIIGVLIWYSSGHFYRSFTLGDTTIDAEFPVWPSKLLVPIAFSLWFLRLLAQLWGAIRLFLDPSLAPVAVVTAKAVAEQAQDEIHEVMGDDAASENKQ
ncbi:TRAP transporter small permease subunit [Shimia thalassica]|uniref:TRAP transporter small permease subunit n=1 Tax=Shimia thalassica TaxID=1715693 RepID=UPI000C07D420|nr:TRAP transporter small permease [Shimia thalassica]MBU2942614.1 TRAP transporter small permease [Shimia thalassica]MDO6800133.1 TRAP transporter small permease [Shimia thalassica]PHO05230.1 C4-dicarboxylate ABC transporter substrate-binding protein [Rhodobacteraceae bacterium 4F10]